MAAVGIVLAWFGYSVFYYGLNTVTGGNDPFVSLIWPGRYKPTARDSGGGGGSFNENVGPSAGQITGSQHENAGGYAPIPNLAPGESSTGPSGQRIVGA